MAWAITGMVCFVALITAMTYENTEKTNLDQLAIKAGLHEQCNDLGEDCHWVK